MSKEVLLPEEDPFLIAFRTMYGPLNPSDEVKRRLDSVAIRLQLCLGPGTFDIGFGQNADYVQIVLSKIPQPVTLRSWMVHFGEQGDYIRFHEGRVVILVAK